MRCLLFGVQLIMGGIVAGCEVLVVWDIVDNGGRGSRT